MVDREDAMMRSENDRYLLEVSRANGGITRIFDKVRNVELISEPRLAGSFCLLVPLPDTEGNYVIGRDQPLSSVEKNRNGLTLHWDGPLISPMGPLDLGVTMVIGLAGEEIRFALTVENRTDYRIAEVWYPMIGGVEGVRARKDTKVMIPVAGWTHDPDLFRNFRGMVELGTPVPEYSFAYPGNMPMPWMDLYNPSAGIGVYFAILDSEARFKVLRLAMQPGIAHCRKDPWPRPEELGDTPSGIVANWTCFPYTPGRETFEGPPVVLRFHDGDWHTAAIFYREWFTSRFALTDPRANWIRGEMAFQDTMLLLPEGNVLMRYGDIPGWARDASDYGVRSVMVSGWDLGGHDNHYPNYEPDPRLGTWEDLADAVRKCHDIGVKVFAFVNLQPVDITTDWYRDELYRFRSMDPWGCSTPMGWGMGTLAARMGITRRPMVKASPSFPEFREIIAGQMKKLAEIGMDGIHVDKLAWASPSADLDFNPELGVSPDRATWEGMLHALEETLACCRAVNPEFHLSIEGPWDRLLEYTDVAWVWHSTWDTDHTSAFKYTFPQWLPALSVTQPYDYNIVNNAVRFGYQLLIGPAHYTASMADGPMRPLSEYIREVQRIREELKETIFFGEFHDQLGVCVEAGGVQDVKFCTHRNATTGKRACVVVNFGEIARDVSVTFDPRCAGAGFIHQPFRPAMGCSFPAWLTIESERFAIVVEE